MLKQRVIVGIPLGIHAEIAHDLSQEANRFSSSVFLSYGGKTASLRSMVSLLALGVSSGCEVELLADGSDEQEAATALTGMLKDRRPAAPPSQT